MEKELSSYILRTSVIERILKALSLRRQPELEDATLLKKWTIEDSGLVAHRSDVPSSWMDWMDWGSNADVVAIENAWYHIASSSMKKMAELLSKLKKGDELSLNGFTIKEGKVNSFAKKQPGFPGCFW